MEFLSILLCHTIQSYREDTNIWLEVWLVIKWVERGGLLIELVLILNPVQPARMWASTQLWARQEWLLRLRQIASRTHLKRTTCCMFRTQDLIQHSLHHVDWQTLWETNTVLPVNKGRVNVQYREVGLLFELNNWLKFVGFAFIIFYRRSGIYQWLPIPCQRVGYKWKPFQLCKKIR